MILRWLATPRAFSIVAGLWLGALLYQFLFPVSSRHLEGTPAAGRAAVYALGNNLQRLPSAHVAKGFGPGLLPVR
jgi:hypothetical protein